MLSDSSTPSWFGTISSRVDEAAPLEAAPLGQAVLPNRAIAGGESFSDVFSLTFLSTSSSYLRRSRSLALSSSDSLSMITYRQSWLTIKKTGTVTI